MQRKILLICLDGCEPSYIEAANTPTLDRIADEGFMVVGESVMPSVTNVNNTSILTGNFPDAHGITSNYWYDRETGLGDYVESSDSVRVPTVLERAKSLGMSTALVTSKVKLLRLLGQGADIAVAAEEPPDELQTSVGPKVGIYSPEINLWSFRAARQILLHHDPDVMYLSTTDFVQHKYAPEHDMAKQHISSMDAILGEIISDNPDREIYVTADHGMANKTVGLDLVRAIGIEDGTVVFMPIIKDKYVLHHDNLAGAAFLFCSSDAARAAVVTRLDSYPEVERVMTSKEAAATYHWPTDRIGDFLVLGRPDVVFGEFDAVRSAVNVRSHGSHHETVVPIYGLNSPVAASKYRYNIDIVRNLGI